MLCEHHLVNDIIHRFTFHETNYCALDEGLDLLEKLYRASDPHTPLYLLFESKAGSLPPFGYLLRSATTVINDVKRTHTFPPLFMAIIVRGQAAEQLTNTFFPLLKFTNAGTWQLFTDADAALVWLHEQQLQTS